MFFFQNILIAVSCFDFTHFFQFFSSISFSYFNFLFCSNLYTPELPFLLHVLGSEQFVIFFGSFFSRLALSTFVGYWTYNSRQNPLASMVHPLQLSHSTISPFSSHLSQCSPHMYTKQTYNTKQNLTQHESCEKCFFIGRRRKTIASILAK